MSTTDIHTQLTQTFISDDLRHALQSAYESIRHRRSDEVHSINAVHDGDKVTISVTTSPSMIELQALRAARPQSNCKCSKTYKAGAEWHTTSGIKDNT